MIIGFGNNTVSSLAADITANQTTIQVMPGEGAKFAKLLSSDYVNTSNPLKVYAKITLTDAKETVFEVCHLTAVNNDMLTVVRGQEGTTAKGWALNDVVANFATRGSENQFIQIEQLQSGNYTSGVAGGSANALTIELPATYFVNSSADWVLRTPIVVYPTQNNTGASTLQLVMGGRVLGTFPLYKGNRAQLVANDILKDVGLVCLMDKTKTFFNVANPGAIYAGLGTAAFKDVVTSMIDATAGRVPVVGWMGLGGTAVRTATVSSVTYDNIPTNLPTGFYTHQVASGPFCHTVTLRQDGGGAASDRHFIIPSQPSDKIAIRWDSGNTFSYQYLYTDKNKPTANDVEAWPIAVRGNLGNGTLLSKANQVGVYLVSIADTSTVSDFPKIGNTPLYGYGFMIVTKNGASINQLYMSHRGQVANRQSWNNETGYVYGWNIGYGTINKPTSSDVGALPIGGGTLNGNLIVNNQIQVGGVGTGIINIGDNDSGLRSSKDGQVDLWANGVFRGYWNTTILSFTGQIIPTNYANFDAKYTPAGQAYTKTESDNRYLQSIRPSGTEEYVDIPYPGQASLPAGAFPTAFVGTTKSTGSGISFHISRVYYRRAQKYIGGAWVNI